MTSHKAKTPAKTARPAAKANSKPVAPAKAAASTKTVKAPPRSLKKTIPARTPVLAKPPKPAVLAAAAVKRAPATPAQRGATPATLDSKLRIFQIYYRPEQRQYLDPAFVPYNNQGDPSPLLEFNVFRKLMRSDLVKGSELWGALSWKFIEKTGLAGAELRQIIARNPGHDVYYCNPYPELEAQYHNLWLQGETAHPNFIALCREFFQAANLDVETLKSFVPSTQFATSNYFVASPRFWTAYVGFVADAIVKADAGMSKTAKTMIYSSAADRLGMHAGASYLPFIVERLFSVFLEKNGNSFSAYKYALPAKEDKLNVHLQLLRQMKDASIKNRSLWLATCWVNYRNLYMSNNYGSEWCRKHLKNITPTEFKYPK